MLNMLKSKRVAAAALAAALMLPAVLAQTGLAATGPTIDKSSVMVWLSKQGLYYPKPGKSDSNTWSWLPNLNFRVNGPFAADTKFVIEYTAGKGPVISSTVSGEEEPEGRWYTFDRVGTDVSEEKGSIHTGPVTMQIRAVNPDQGLNQVLYKGSFNVKKYQPYDPKQFPDFKNKFDYYVDQDWRMPVAYLTSKWIASDGNPEPTPPLAFKLWFNGSSDTIDGQAEAQLYYQGKQISKATPGTNTWTTSETSPYAWTEASYMFTGNWEDESNKPVFFSSQWGSESNPNAHLLNQNPGEYEIKVMHQGKLSRIIKFTIGADGKPVDKGAAAAINTLDRWPVPVQIVTQTDGKWDANAWKAGMFYSNPVSTLLTL